MNGSDEWQSPEQSITPTLWSDSKRVYYLQRFSTCKLRIIQGDWIGVASIYIYATMLFKCLHHLGPYLEGSTNSDWVNQNMEPPSRIDLSDLFFLREKGRFRNICIINKGFTSIGNIEKRPCTITIHSFDIFGKEYNFYYYNLNNYFYDGYLKHSRSFVVRINTIH